MVDVFISYAHEDKDRAEVIARALQAAGLDVWWDISLLPGQRFIDEIRSMIETAKATVVLWSEHSVKSSFVYDEASLANSLGRLVPVLLDTVQPPMGFGNIQTLDMTGWSGQEAAPEMETLLEGVRRFAGPTEKPEASVSPPDVDDHKAEVTFWREISENPSSSPSDFRLYLDQFGESGLFSKLARQRIQSVPAPPPAKGTGRPPILLALYWLTAIGIAGTLLVLLVNADGIGSRISFGELTGLLVLVAVALGINRYVAMLMKREN